MRKFSMLLFAIGMMATGLAFGQEDRLKKVNVSGYFDSSSRYVNRGLPVVDNAVYQTAIDLTIMNVGPGHIGIGWWGNYTLEDSFSPIGRIGERAIPNPDGATSAWEANEYTEYRWKIGYALLLPGNSMLEMGISEIVYPHDGTDDTDTTEIYAKFKAGLMRNDFMDAFFTLHAYYDTDEAEGWYMAPGVMTEMKVAGSWKAFVNANIGWATDDYNEYYYGNGADSNTFNDFTLEAGIGAPLDKNISVKIGLGFSEIIDNDLADAVDDAPGLTSGNSWFKIGIHGKF